MPISDLLASISGGAGKGPAPNATMKRKASSDLPSNANKTQRVTPPPPKPMQSSRPSNDRPSSSAQRYTGTAGGRPPVPTSRAAPTPNKPKPVSAASSSPAASAPMKSAPKKGSFAEILARGKAAQVSMGQVGRIQHKKVENPPKRSKDEQQETTTAVPASRGKKPLPSGYGGTSRPSQRPMGGSVTNGSGPRRPGASSSSMSKPRPQAGSGAGGKSAARPEPEKKIKKSVTATTGYAGTARPKPGGEVKKRHEAPRGGALLSAPKQRPRGGSNYDDEYDEDMDDFIDYDDEEEEAGGEPRYGYASDASSDMEAGMDDIYDEEDRAARIARQEDIREERLEKNLKAAKEERRRKAMGYR